MRSDGRGHVSDPSGSGATPITGGDPVPQRGRVAARRARRRSGAATVALVVDNGSDDGTASVASGSGAGVVDGARPRLRRGGPAGVSRRRPPAIVCVLDGDGSLDPGELPGLVALLRSGADLAVGRRVPGAGDAGWPLHARIGNAVVAARLRQTVPPRASTTSAPCGPHDATRCWPGGRGPAIGLSARAAGPGRAGRSAGRGASRHVPPADGRPVQGVRLGRGQRRRHLGLPQGDPMSAVAVRRAGRGQGAGGRTGQDPAGRGRSRPEAAAELAAAALLDTLDAVRGSCDVARRRGPHRRPRRAPGGRRDRRVPWPTSSSSPSAATGSANGWPRPTPTRPRRRRPVLQIGMDTPQVTGRPARRGRRALLGEGDVAACSARRPTAGGGRSGCHRPDTASLLGDIPMSQSDTGARTLAGLAARGLTVVDLPELTDVDTPADARPVAPGMPAGGRFPARRRGAGPVGPVAAILRPGLTAPRVR